jgi:(1->4)-alpha-D-glucan 1-alpha-D-glucosylmutase
MASPLPTATMSTYFTEPMTGEEFARFRERIASYMLKATKEAKVHTSWVNPHEEYDTAVQDFVLGVLSEDGDNPFLRDFREFQERAAYYGHTNSLAQLLLKLTSPGVPDFYQGTELWELSLVDPDNRRPVDFNARARLLAELKRRESKRVPTLVKDLLTHWEDGRVKLYVTHKALNFRRAHRDVFGEGDYVPLSGAGAARNHLVAFARHRRETWVLVAVPRLVARLCAPGQPPTGAGVWEESVVKLPHRAPASWRNVLTNEVVRVTNSHGAKALRIRDLLRSLPVALLSSASA